MSQQSPLLGYNNNVPYKGRMYHVQTEDSGRKRPHIITHLFADGGRVVTSKKISYAEHVDTTADLDEMVRRMMKEQHKGMVISLRDGELDHIIEQETDVPPVPEPEVIEEIPVEVLERAAEIAERELLEGFLALARAAAAAAEPQVPPDTATGYSLIGLEDEAPARPPEPPARPPEPPAAMPAPESEEPWVFGAKIMSRRTLDRVMLEFLNEQFGYRGKG